MSGRWRTGRKVGRTIYAQLGADPSDTDALIGVMDTSELADTAATAVWLRHGPSDMNRLLMFLGRADIGHAFRPLRDDDLPIEMREVVVPGLFRALFDEAGVLIKIAPLHTEDPS